MKKWPFIMLIAATALSASFTQASVTCNGNGNTGFGGAVGNGVLSLSDDGTNVYGTFTMGSGNFNDCLVLYIQSGGPGFADTSGFTDTGDGSRIAISGYSGPSQQSVLTFAAGFSPNYAIALGPRTTISEGSGRCPVEAFPSLIP